MSTSYHEQKLSNDFRYRDSRQISDQEREYGGGVVDGDDEHFCSAQIPSMWCQEPAMTLEHPSHTALPIALSMTGFLFSN